MTAVSWTEECAEVHCARVELSGGVVAQLMVESLGETGWDWHVWDGSGGVQQRYGLADSLAEAKGKAEEALLMLARELGRAV